MTPFLRTGHTHTRALLFSVMNEGEQFRILLALSARHIGAIPLSIRSKTALRKFEIRSQELSRRGRITHTPPLPPHPPTPRQSDVCTPWRIFVPGLGERTLVFCLFNTFLLLLLLLMRSTSRVHQIFRSSDDANWAVRLRFID